MKVKDAQFFTVVSSFLNVYLVKNRSCSSNTVKSYEDALNLLFTFLEGTKDIPRYRPTWREFDTENHRLLWLAISQKKNFLFSSRSRTAKSVQDSGIWCFWF